MAQGGVVWFHTRTVADRVQIARCDRDNSRGDGRGGGVRCGECGGVVVILRGEVAAGRVL